MKVHTAQLAGDTTNADRVFVTDTAVILLDGASAFEPAEVDPGTYAETIGVVIAEQLDITPGIEIAHAVSTAITHAVERLDLHPGRSPSSTVSVLRAHADAADLYVLGDSPIYFGTDAETRALTDDRLAALPLPERDTYGARLRAEHGYDDEHRTILTVLQTTQGGYRNTERGYWIAETDPNAAHHAVVDQICHDAITWALLATDGVTNLLDHFGRNDWADIAHHDDHQLAELLDRIHRWEHHQDPHGQHLPRAKRHDDKTIAAITSLW